MVITCDCLPAWFWCCLLAHVMVQFQELARRKARGKMGLAKDCSDVSGGRSLGHEYVRQSHKLIGQIFFFLQNSAKTWHVYCN